MLNSYDKIDTNHKQFNIQKRKILKYIEKLSQIIIEKTDYKLPTLGYNFGLKITDSQTALGACVLDYDSSDENDILLCFDRYLLTFTKSYYIEHVGTHEFCHAIVEYNHYLKTGSKEINIGHGKEWQDLMILLGQDPVATYEKNSIISKYVSILQGTKTKKYLCSECKKEYYIDIKFHNDYMKKLVPIVKNNDFKNACVIYSECCKESFLLPYDFGKNFQ